MIRSLYKMKIIYIGEQEYKKTNEIVGNEMIPDFKFISCSHLVDWIHVERMQIDRVWIGLFVSSFFKRITQYSA